MPLFRRKPKARCPVTPDDKSFIEANYQWLIHQFGAVRERPVIQLSKLRIPATGDLLQTGDLLVNFCCKNMQIDRDQLEVDYFQRGNSGMSRMSNIRFEDGYNLGEYHHRDPLTGKYLIHLNVEALLDLEKAVATIAHELSHVKLIGEFRISGHEEAHEYLTDLTVIYFGFGIFQANSSFSRSTWSAGEYSGWSMSKSGYLPLEMTGYALALHAYLHGSSQPAWMGEVKREPRRFVEDGLAYLLKTDDCTVTDE